MRSLILYITVLLLYNNSLAQEKKDFMRYEYSLTYRPYDIKVMPDSLAVTEKFYLDIEGSNSVFMSDVVYDSYIAEVEKSEYEGKDSAIMWYVTKNNLQMTFYEIVNYFDFYKVNQPLNLIKWGISDKIEDYHGMKVQKATGELSGRIWTVWFTTEISIIDGPYKFKNLPGFVVKAQDSNQDYVFEFTNSKKVSNYWYDENSNRKVKEVTDKQLKMIKSKGANMTCAQGMEAMGAIIDKSTFDADDFMFQKIGKESNPIEYY